MDELRACIARSTVRTVLSQRIQPDAAKKDGITTLMQVSYVGREDLAEDLVVRGSDVEAKDNAGYTALMYACNGGRLNTARVLIRSGVDPNAADSQGSTASLLLLTSANRMDTWQLSR
jgi:ankyrin repeat protein